MIYQASKPTIRKSGKESRALSLRGNGKFGNVVRSGWERCNLGHRKKAAAKAALEHPDTDRAWRVGTDVYRLLLNGNVEKVA